MDLSNQEGIICKAIEYVKTLFSGNSDGHDANHTLRVYKNVQLLLESYPEADSFISSLSALLHDVDDHKLFKTQNNDNARNFLQENGLSEELIENICEIINSVSFSKNKGKTPRTIEGQIVQDADRLDAIGAIGIARTFAYGGRAGRSLEDSIQHFYDKLLLLKDEMNTEAALKIAMERHEYMENFLKEYFEESIIDAEN
ncbi:HD domain-containing protein [Pseudobutyrivibrio sp.]|uniref:HD domain-containing protein n=1 Tax=Pseudobutyrivibrio sp. TaxID=2014367 RepID=UPI0025F0A206|nr:HD domain-containing protein [Pseudobutyrivibrio sp.]MBR5648688.1 HD domain-containing protein [Pseudobutyrivibrio sp.]